ncbi:MAG: site-2 protease family protein [Planctomycetaceae bacterium]|nr:site-2 protease family protein [Planctomycetaceae bacterium]
MDETRKNDQEWPEPETIAPELVQVETAEMSAGAPWEWVDVRPVRPRRRWRLPLLLFLATCLTTLLAGASGKVWIEEGWLAGLISGLRYAVPVMTILLCHEMGHFIQAHRYGVYASWPYFIPMPFSPIGTMGAVIAMEPRVGHRRALFDIGISGPLAGLVPTIIFLVVGLKHSSFAVPVKDAMLFGDPLLVKALVYWIMGPTPKGYEVVIDPMAFAGWVGLLVTSLNLIPIGQLDGGHILYALLRRRAHRVAKTLLLTALFLVIWKWEILGQWTLMIVLLFLMGPIHPPTADDEEPLGVFRYILGWATLAFIVVGFTPTPLLNLP